MSLARARVIGVGAKRTIGKGVLIGQGFRFPRKILLEVGEHTQINNDISIGGTKLTVGKHSLILSGTSIDCIGGVEIGSYSQIGRNNEIYSHKHLVGKRNVSVLKSPEEIAPVKIGDDVMFFSNVKLMPGIQVANGVVALNSSVLTKNVQAFGIYGGVPAKKIGKRE